ncbi:ABC transporter ATP-binding protein [Klenkia taihuensis]|uniref:Iron(III) transport system ATP-binding protein n=1 Tax=Klenkia taihuensis TaxID=1225127 RepID=A0A1I1PY69_9ACTN|nr:ABC transporter ATP-binding protein [Klenkia taihuensis]GHE08345.1 Fe3+/spermidine/putrescine ABC transporter ATP-binding protein [Klenkia taihuensis]SFD14705.1 iron(III) transport system ATP-binding protein [Klenkia taihuensis]
MQPDAASAPSTPVVEVNNLLKRFRREDGALVHAIDDVTLTVDPGDFVVLLGPSGCGKTTLLRAIAGLETPDSGQVRISGRTVYSSAERVELPPERRDISMIFQSYALWPHMTAFKNVAYPLQSRRGRKLGKDEIARRVRQALELVGVGELERQYPGQMSGGQQQRIALARALVNNDDLVLFDEPLSNVDAKVREQLRFELVSMQRELGFSALFVTHDQVEAMELAHRIAVLDRGRVVQFGTPQEIYRRPATRYVATFIGAMNEAPGRVVAVDGSGHDGTVTVETEHGRVTGRTHGARHAVGDRVAALWRPEHGALHRSEPTAPNRWPGAVKAGLFVGSHTEYVVTLAGGDVRLWSPRPDLVAVDASAWVSVDVDDVLVLPEDQSSEQPQDAPAGELATAS